MPARSKNEPDEGLIFFALNFADPFWGFDLGLKFRRAVFDMGILLLKHGPRQVASLVAMMESECMAAVLLIFDNFLVTFTTTLGACERGRFFQKSDFGTIYGSGFGLVELFDGLIPVPELQFGTTLEPEKFAIRAGLGNFGQCGESLTWF